MNNSRIMIKTMKGNDDNLTFLPYALSKVSCGSFGISEDHMEKYLSLDEYLIKHQESSFFIECQGNSMEPYIVQGDILIVDCDAQIFNGKIVVAVLDDGFVCKRFFRNSSNVILKSINSEYRDIVVTEEMNFRVFGVVTALARKIK